MVKTLFIDLDDTLWATSINNKVALELLYREARWTQYFDSFETYYEIYSSVNIELWFAYNQNKIDMQELSIERMHRPLLIRGVDLSKDECLQLNERFIAFMQEQSLLCPDALEVIAYLKKRYKICILSNGFGQIQIRKLADTGLLAYVDEVVLSSDLGISKPDRRIFEFAQTKVDATKEEVLMIGDSWCSDIHGASNANIRSIWYNPNGYEFPEDPDTYPPLYSIGKLIELKDLL